MDSLILENGLTILHEPRPNTSMGVSLMVCVGPLGENRRISGISHFIEHMLFEGTAHRTAYEIAYGVEKVGGEFNAYTAQDRTCITARVLPRYLRDVLDVIYDVVNNPLFAKEKVEKERSVILSEISMRRDEPRCLQWDLLVSRLFAGSVAAQPVLGTKKSVSSMSHRTLRNFFRAHYHPPRMILSLVGGRKRERDVAARMFSKMSGEPVSPQSADIPLTQTKRSSKRSLGNHQTYLILGVRAPSVSHEDAPVFEIMRALLGKGMSGRLFNEIRIKRGLGYDVGAYYVGGAHHSFFVLNAVAARDDIRECERLIHACLRDLENVSSQELQDAKTFLEAERIFEKEDNEQYADTLAYSWYGGVDVDSYDAAIKRVTLADVRRIARSYLKGPYTRVCVE